MIITNIVGGLGNQMFQYAFGKYLALKHNTELKLDISRFERYKTHKYRLNAFCLKENIASRNEIEYIKNKDLGIIFSIINKIRSPINRKLSKYYIQESFFHFEPKMLNLPDNVYLNGFWQSEKYFKEISDIIKKDFTVKNPLYGKNQEFAIEISNCNSVSLHVRRGNYIKDVQAKAIHHVDLNAYYKSAINLICEKINNPHFYIFSDDPIWTKSHYGERLNCSIIDLNNADNDYEDLRLMSLCKHNITANSSFSWWGAWLNNNLEKLVITPGRWLNNDEHDTKDLQPESWIKL